MDEILQRMDPLQRERHLASRRLLASRLVRDRNRAADQNATDWAARLSPGHSGNIEAQHCGCDAGVPAESRYDQ